MPFHENLKLTALFDELVPPSGASSSIAGELVRAISKIGYRLYNDGDLIGIGYGNETCNAPARFLIANLPKKGVEIVSCMWGNHDEPAYEKLLEELEQFIVDYIEEVPALRKIPLLDEGMLDDMYRDESDYTYEEDDDMYADFSEDTYYDDNYDEEID